MTRMAMTVRDLFEPRLYLFDDEILMRGRVIALDECTGRQLFDTNNNKRVYIRQFYDRVVTAIWASVKAQDHGFYGAYATPVTMVYVSHSSEKGEEDES